MSDMTAQVLANEEKVHALVREMLESGEPAPPSAITGVLRLLTLIRMEGEVAVLEEVVTRLKTGTWPADLLAGAMAASREIHEGSAVRSRQVRQGFITARNDLKASS